MSYVKSNINVFGGFARDYTIAELETMTVEQFDKLPLADQVNIYNTHKDVYDRLTGNTVPSAEDSRTEAEAFADTFEQRVSDIITRAFHGDNR